MNSGQPARASAASIGSMTGTRIWEIDAPTERRCEPPRFPITSPTDLIQHDLRAIEVKVGEAFLGPVENHREPARVVPESQALVDVHDE
jgi:hypothetical protein